MEITRFIDDFGDDIFALALVVTKNFDSAKQVFAKISADCEQFPESLEMYDLAKRVLSECEDVDSNEAATTLTGIDLDPKRQQILEELLSNGEAARTAAHLFFENDLDTKQISELMKKSEDFVTSLFDKLNYEALDSNYKDICTKIKAGDRLKSYIIRSISKGNKRPFSESGEAVPNHRWKLSHKIIVLLAAFVGSAALLTLYTLFIEPWLFS